MKNIISILIICCVYLGCSESYDVPNHVPGIVKVIDSFVFVAYGEGGLIVYDDATGEEITQLFPPRKMGSIDDFDVDGSLVFILDSRGRDYMSVYNFLNNSFELLTGPIKVEGGPFNGISASNGNLVIAGGTTFMNRFTYSQDGSLQGPISFGRDRGHPDVLLSQNGQAAFFSTDFDAIVYGLTSVSIGSSLSIPFTVSEIGLPGAGITSGLTKPVGFPIQTALFGNNLVAAHGGGLTIINLVETHTFATNTTYNINTECVAIAIDNNLAYVTGYQNGNPVMLTIDLQDISSPNVVSTEFLPINDNVPTSVAVGENFVYITAENSGILKIMKN